MSSEKHPTWITWLKRIGLVGFLFFLIKGLAWIAIALFAGNAIFSSGC